MSIMNKCQFVGNLTKDAEYKVLPSGTKVFSFTVAVFKGYKKDEQNNPIIENGYKVKESEFINVSAFGQTAELAADKKAEKLVKGAKVIVECKFNGVRTYTSSTNNQVVGVADFLLENINDVDVLVAPKNQNQQNAPAANNQQYSNGPQNGYNQGQQPQNNGYNNGYNQGQQPQNNGYNQGNGYNNGGYNQGYNQGPGNLPFE